MNWFLADEEKELKSVTHELRKVEAELRKLKERREELTKRKEFLTDNILLKQSKLAGEDDKWEKSG